jgi:hypothetical protein
MEVQDTEDVAVDTAHFAEDAFVKPIKGSAEPKICHGIAPAFHTLELHDAVNGWDYVDSTTYKVRGKGYLKDRIKIASLPSVFELAEVSGYSAVGKIMFSTERADSYYVRARSAGRKQFLFVMHFDLNPMHAVMSFEVRDSIKSDPAFETCWKRFLKGDDEYKNKRIKLIPAIVQANWMVRKTVGKPVPALIGNKLKCHWRQTEDLLECTCDVTSSMAAAAIVSVIKSSCKNIVCDLVILLEGQQEDELPERVIGAVRIIHHDPARYHYVDR